MKEIDNSGGKKVCVKLRAICLQLIVQGKAAATKPIQLFLR